MDAMPRVLLYCLLLLCSVCLAWTILVVTIPSGLQTYRPTTSTYLFLQQKLTKNYRYPVQIGRVNYIHVRYKFNRIENTHVRTSISTDIEVLKKPKNLGTKSTKILHVELNPMSFPTVHLQIQSTLVRTR